MDPQLSKQPQNSGSLSSGQPYLDCMTDGQGAPVWPPNTTPATAMESSLKLEALDESWQIYLATLYTLTAITSFILNAITVIFLARFHKCMLRRYLINLSVSDLLMSLLSIPFTYTEYMLGRWIFASFLCPIVRFVDKIRSKFDRMEAVFISLSASEGRVKMLVNERQSINSKLANNSCATRPHIYYEVTLSVFVSVATMTVIGINRYLAIMYPLRDRRGCLSQLQPRVRQFHVIVAIWLLGVAISAPEYLMSSVEPFCYNHQLYFQCRSIWSESTVKSYTVFIFLCTFAIPLLLLSFLYTSIGLKLWHHKVPGNVDVNRDLSMHTTRVKVIKMLFVVVILFAVSWLPSQTFYVIMILFPDIRAGFVYPSLAYTFFVFTNFAFHWLSMAHSCLNPLIYCFMNDKFRSDLKAFICKSYRRRSLHIGHSIKSASHTTLAANSQKRQHWNTEPLDQGRSGAKTAICFLSAQTSNCKSKAQDDCAEATTSERQMKEVYIEDRISPENSIYYLASSKTEQEEEQSEAASGPSCAIFVKVLKERTGRQQPPVAQQRGSRAASNCLCATTHVGQYSDIEEAEEESLEYQKAPTQGECQETPKVEGGDGGAVDL